MGKPFRLVAAAAAFSLSALGVAASAGAVEQATGTSAVTKTTATFTFRGGVTAALTVTANNPTVYGTDGFWLQPATAHATYAATPGMFYPGLDTVSTPTVGFYTTGGECGTKDATGLNWVGYCPHHGTVTLDFGRLVTDPIMDISGLGGNAYCVNSSTTSGKSCPLYRNAVPRNTDGSGNDNAAGFSSMELDIAGATGAGGAPTNVDFADLSAGATNLAITAKSLQTANKYTDSMCNQSNNNNPQGGPAPLGIAVPAGCGSVTLRGTFSSVTFDVGTWIARSPNAAWVNGYNWGRYDTSAANNGNADLARVSFRLREDTGDAPASYEGAQAAVHLDSGLTLGHGWTDDSSGVVNPTASLLSGPAADEDADDAIGDGVTAPDGVWTKPYTLEVPISGTLQDGAVAGWIDFNGNGVFDTGERAQASFLAGDAAVVLTWPGAGTATTGTTDTYLRLRTSFVVSEVLNPSGIATSGEVEDYLIRLVDPVPDISVSKKVTGTAGPDAAGDYTAGYDITVTNDGTGSGTYALSDLPDFAANLVITDVAWQRTDVPGPVEHGGSPMPAAGYPVAGTTTIDDGDTHTYHVLVTYHYANAQAVVACAGPGTGLYNAVAGAEDGPASDNADCAGPPPPPAPGLQLVKRIARIDDVDGDDENSAGDLVWYEFDLTNTGDVALSDLAVDDPLLVARGITVSCLTASLAPGATTTCTSVAGYVITGDDVDNGVVTNVATARGEHPYGDPGDPTDDVVSNDSHREVVLPQHPALMLDKKAGKVTDVDHDGLVDLGDTVLYTFDLTNTGNVTLHDVRVTDPMLTKAGIGVTCPVVELGPSRTVTCTADQPYTVTAADVSAGHVTNTASATGRTPASTDGAEGDLVDANDDTVDIPTQVPPLPSTDPPGGDNGHGPRADLPNTGGPRRGLLLVGSLLALAGAGLVLLGRGQCRPVAPPGSP